MAARPTKEQRVAAQIEREERRRAATRLAVDGVSYEEIAERLGYNSRQAAHRDVKAGLAPAVKALREEADHFLAVQMARLEQMHADARRIHDEYATADEYSDKADQRLAALDRVAKASAEFRKLTGLDAPAKTETKTTLDATVGYRIDVTSEELEQL